MKLQYISFLTLLWALTLVAQSEEAVIPTDVSEPPYEIGNLVSEQGYYIERGEEKADINLRIVDNKLRLYWIDQNGLIAEPEYQSATIRFIGSVRGRTYHRLDMLPEASGLGAPGVILAPHIYSVILVFPSDDGEQNVTYSFRYTPAMDEEIDPTAGPSS